MELFAGAGGLALGCQEAGFDPLATLELDKWACDTVRQNQARGNELVANWHVEEGDVRDFNWSRITDEVDLVAGGPPCQPFSIGGRGKADDDERDMFPATAEAIAQLRPRAFIIENVRGLARPRFADYFQYIQARLSLPLLAAKPDELWGDHLLRLRAAGKSVSNQELAYRVTPAFANAADYGVPQQRQRVFLVGFRNDLDVTWDFPHVTHSRRALLHAQWTTGEYWQEHEVPKAKRPERPNVPIPEELQPDEVQARWRTIRDALAGLPEPTVTGTAGVLNHVLQLGARSYPGHTGSPVDWPAKTLKAGRHGVPGGENMLREADGSIRYFTVRESARLQTFPDDYELHGPWGKAMRQLGNAVPVELARVVADSVHAALRAEGTEA
ncbi:DNA cytosine methyltransferase [Streptomyces sp. NBC_01428]|uniref:DNA cytosine methyltransferase n=1 Tax=Streptomyces sp. NBC_01428 TaxID=2903861 RepID=UPI002E3530A3|nr:DNA cytosine methyltransferase [Streptomyces sp. NBC_01428]